MDSAALRSCRKCHQRMGSLKHDSHTICSHCREVVCSVETRCSKCQTWFVESMLEYLKYKKSLAGKRGKKPAVTAASVSQPAVDSSSVEPSPPSMPSVSEDSRLKDAVLAVLQSLSMSGSLGINQSSSTAPSTVLDYAGGATGGDGGMKLHNVDSLSRSSGAGALDNSAIFTSPVMHHDLLSVFQSRARHSHVVGSVLAAPMAALIGHPPLPLVQVTTSCESQVMVLFILLRLLYLLLASLSSSSFSSCASFFSSSSASSFYRFLFWLYFLALFAVCCASSFFLLFFLLFLLPFPPTLPSLLLPYLLLLFLLPLLLLPLFRLRSLLFSLPLPLSFLCLPPCILHSLLPFIRLCLLLFLLLLVFLLPLPLPPHACLPLFLLFLSSLLPLFSILRLLLMLLPVPLPLSVRCPLPLWRTTRRSCWVCRLIISLWLGLLHRGILILWGLCALPSLIFFLILLVTLLLVPLFSSLPCALFLLPLRLLPLLPSCLPLPTLLCPLTCLPLPSLGSLLTIHL